jgi:two-component system, chemotaxis family, protein-glutamate methylesterase/glutaminase
MTKSDSGPIRCLIVDDSATVRAILRRTLEADGRVKVIGVAKDGLEAVELVPHLKPDVITLDVEMPRLNGLQALKRIMAERPTPVVMVSSLTSEGAESTLQALELGAIDFIAKPSSGLAPSKEVLDKVIEAAGARVRAPRKLATPPRRPSQMLTGSGAQWNNVTVVIGSSTGGPQALREVVSRLPADLKVPVIIVQHMPPDFTRTLAERLDTLTPLPVREAQDGDSLARGKILVAPGDYHLTSTFDGHVKLNQAPAECGVRPAINVTIESVVERRKGHVVTAILTGMGSDGTRGAGLVKAAGGYVITEDESTCTIYGMPRSIERAGFSDEVAPIEGIADAIVNQCRQAVRRSA